MPFDKVETQVDFPAREREILKLWERIRAFDKLREKNRGKPRWSFLDGPITANNPMGVHHAWGRTYKDAYQRFFNKRRPLFKTRKRRAILMKADRLHKRLPVLRANQNPSPIPEGFRRPLRYDVL